RRCGSWGQTDQSITPHRRQASWVISDASDHVTKRPSARGGDDIAIVVRLSVSETTGPWQRSISNRKPKLRSQGTFDITRLSGSDGAQLNSLGPAAN
ncbi:MAG: hypothetical protein K0Q60_3781, partial [Microvirga sp.]|nr:hypothetical protein [Microvirga sp.]